MGVMLSFAQGEKEKGGTRRKVARGSGQDPGPGKKGGGT